MRSRGAAGLGLTFVLLLLALVGKLAFLNLRALSPSRVSLLGGWPTEEGSKLREQLRALEHEKESLVTRIEKVKTAQKLQEERREEEHEKALKRQQLLNHLQWKLKKEEAQSSILSQQLQQMRGAGTKSDEEAVAELVKAVHDAKEIERYDAGLRANREERRLAANELANTAANQILRQEGLKPLKASPQQLNQVHKLQDKVHGQIQKNRQIWKRNMKLVDEIKKEQKMLANEKRLFGSKALAAAGVVADSWGPLTADLATKPDPRDSFAQLPSVKVVTHKAKKPVKKVQKVHQHISESQLEKDLGFTGSFLESKTFAKTW